MSRPTAPSAAVQAAVLLQGEPYYLGGLWALTFHRLTEQQYVSVLDAFVSRRRRSRRLGGARLVFHPTGSERLGYGNVASDLEGMSVQLSDPKRTLIDLLDFPALAGGGGEALRMVQQALPGLIPPRSSTTRRKGRGEARASGSASFSSALERRPGG
jgi:predicted transcriptional regulator of viral defense system